MRKSVFVNLIILIIIGLLSCSKTGRVKDFVTDFNTAAQKNDTSTLFKMYPNLKGCSCSIKTNYNLDSLIIEELENGFLVKIGNGKDLIIIGKDEFFIKDSHGVYIYDPLKLKMGYATGWIVNGMSDNEMSDRFKEQGFVDYLINKFHAQIKSKLVVRVASSVETSSYPMSNYVIEVTNRSSLNIAGDQYVVRCRFYNIQEQKYHGKDIKAGETVSFIYSAYQMEGHPTAELIIEKPTEKDLFEKFSANGDEYDNYKNSYNSDTPKDSKISSLITKLLNERISEDELVGLSKEELSILRNSIYAKHGYIFANENLGKYFSAMPWYNGTTTDMNKVAAEFDDIEKYNVRFIKDFENRNE